MLGVIIGGLVVVVIIAVAVLVRTRQTTVVPAAQDRLGPVLLVPGYGGTGTSLEPMAAQLRSAGREVVIVSPVGDGTGDLDAQAAHLGQVAEQSLERADATAVDVVGYSAGGVVARLWVRDHGGGPIARRVLTLGAPQHGTSQAALGAEFAGGCPTACEQLVPDSDLLRKLNAGDETPDGPAWITLRSTSDKVVTPVDSAALDGALNLVIQDACPTATTGHPGLPTDPVTYAALTSTLGVNAPAAPTDVVC